MKAPIAFVAAAVFIGSTTLVTAFYAPSLSDISNVQLVQDKMTDKKKEEMMKEEKMKEEKMAKDEKMKKDEMMKDDKKK
ncbi:MAG: hypothetical protein WD871_08330 [Xanthobacteraceae bacterium]